MREDIPIRRMEKNDERYSSDKPSDCRYCYYFTKKGCKLEKCHYLLQPEPPRIRRVIKGQCPGCPYGVGSPCIGFCMEKILREMRFRKQKRPYIEGSEKHTGGT